MVQELSRALSEMGEKPEILDVSQVADLLRVSTQTVYNQIRAGKLPAVKVGREWRFTRSAVMQMLTKTADASPSIAREAATTVYGPPEDAAGAGIRPNATEPTDPTA
jgi:excisionase family DNA binding protein